MQNHKADNKQLSSAMWHIANELRGVAGLRDGGVMMPLTAYIAILMQDEDEGVALQNVLKHADVSRSVKDFLLSSFDEKWVEAARTLSRGQAKEALRDYVLHYDFSSDAGKWSGEYGTPDCISKLALAILDIEPGEHVADFGCGYGNFLVAAADAQPTGSYYGVELNAAAACLAQVRMDLLGVESVVEIGDMLSSKPTERFHKVFSNYPFGMSLQKSGGVGAYYEEFNKGNTGFGRPASADWIFNKLICDGLDPDGKAVAITTSGAAFNGGDKLARKHFLDRGMIEAVVALPSNLFRYTMIATTLIVFGNNDGPVRFVDASDLTVPGRRWDTMGDDEVNEIVRRLSEDGDSSKLVAKEEVAAAEYSLSPSRYLGREIEMVNPTSIGDLADSIERGAGLSARDLDAISTDEDTGISYLRLSDISDGRFVSNLPRIQTLDAKFSKQCLRTGDLIISKNGAPFKVAVAEIPEGQTILANGNLYIIRLKTELANPYYVAAFLSSEDGKETMSRMVVGTTIPNLPQKNLRLIEIPLPPMEEQQEIADHYQARLDEIEVLKIKLEKARNGAASAYDEVMGR